MLTKFGKKHLENNVIFVKSYCITLIIFLSLDFVWLGLVAREFYASQLNTLIREDINYLAAGFFYLLYVGGIVYFVVGPALAEADWRKAAINGLLLGLIAYATYDMTNMATLKNWPVLMTFVDIAWGGVLTCLSGVLGY